jgi:hypothetical protein
MKRGRWIRDLRSGAEVRRTKSVFMNDQLYKADYRWIVSSLLMSMDNMISRFDSHWTENRGRQDEERAISKSRSSSSDQIGVHE